MTDAVLTINAGSSSIKFAVFELAADGPPRQTVHGMIEGIGTAAHFLARGPDGAQLAERRWKDGAKTTHEDVLAELLPWTQSHLGGDRLVAAGHRVVHGGRKLDRPVRLDDAVMAEIEALIPLAPLHQPHSLEAIRALRTLAPDLVQVACFDTAFHRTMPEVARRIALPWAITEAGVERYGFHGLSYEYIAGRLAAREPALAAGRVVVAHLGSGASLCGLHGGRSMDTTMGFTALDGLPMGTRCGALDPGVVLYLQQARSMSPEAVSDMLYKQSGLLGVSGLSSDMRTLLASDAVAAREAVELFAFRIARETGALAASLGGFDGLVFTAGIGEHAPALRRMVCHRLAWLGVTLDEAANARPHGRISAAGSRVAVHVIPTDEEAMIARHTAALLG